MIGDVKLINISNQKLKELLIFKLNKTDDKISIDELKSITELVLNPVDISGHYNSIDLSLLNYLISLEDLELINMYIDKETILILSKYNNLKNLVFDKCQFEDSNLISLIKVESLSLIECEIVNYEFLSLISNLKSLILNNSVNLNFEYLSYLENLKILSLAYSQIDTKTIGTRLPAIEELYLYDSSIDDLSFIYQITSLKLLGISKNQYIKNQELIDELKETIKIVNENMIEYEGEHYD